MLQLFWAMYVASFMGILAFSLMELQLVVVGWIRKNNTQLPALLTDTLPSDLPNVTVQLPIFNEQYVAARIIDAVVALQYPRQCLQIQVLDDSTDQTLLISQQKIAHYQALGYNIVLLHRHHRTAYKAGALQAALPLATGNFVALFDADFVPSPNFLLHTLPYFDQAKVGAVQTRWGHLNRTYSLLTRIQAFFIDTHFA
ncbi:MAG: glycosyltransferase, partial [Chitinophagales bacterium]|nr:glycosyltransferase [Chitinophagales bacterium]